VKAEAHTCSGYGEKIPYPCCEMMGNEPCMFSQGPWRWVKSAGYNVV